MKVIDLPIPPEPTKIKEDFNEELEKGSKLGQANIKQGAWIVSPLWTEMDWGSILKTHGFSWQDFNKAVRIITTISLNG